MSNYNNITFCLNHSGELEADSIGLKLVASTGCDPRVALAIYKKTDFEESAIELENSKVMEEALDLYEKVKVKVQTDVVQCFS